MSAEYKYKTGDRVFLNEKKFIISGRYYPNGCGYNGNIPAYTIYPPSKKNSYGYHRWCYEKDLVPR